MRILVVDDEPRHLRGMVNLIGQLRPHAEVVFAKDGLTALELVRSFDPDAVLADIRMPGLDGLAFLQQLKAEGIKSMVIMVSAYNLFEYAQTAVRHGAYDYLLKPVEIERIEEVLSRIEQQLDLEQLKRCEAEELEQRLRLASSAYRNRLTLSWLNGSMTAAEHEELNTYELLQSGGVIVYSELRNSGGGDAKGDGTLLLRSLEQGWSRWGEATTVVLNGVRQGGGQAAVTVIVRSLLTPQNRSEARSIAAALAAEWDYAGVLTHGIGPECGCLLTDAPHAYRLAQTAHSYNFYDCWEGVLFHDELKPPRSPAVLDPDRLYEALKGKDAALAIEICRESFGQLSEGGHGNPAWLKDNASLLLLKIKSESREIADKKIGSMLTDCATLLIRSCSSYKELLTLLEDALREVQSALAQAKLDKGEIVIAKCLSWIQEQMKEELTLERAAEHFFFNASYFSTLIKSRTGRTFSEHVTAVRMKRAKELLAENKLRIYEISLECGYQDKKYFCRVFKKYHGMSPEAYKHASLPERKVQE